MAGGQADDNAGVKSFWIIGSGRFGRIAAARLWAGYPGTSILVVDHDARALGELPDLPVRTVQRDGVDFLVNELTGKDIPSYIVPAVPFHLAFEWLKRKLAPSFQVSRVPVPEEVYNKLPNPIGAGKGKLYASYAAFICPDNCPEPRSFCTVTRKERAGLLYRDCLELKIEGFVSLGIRSIQLAPGVGGYKPEALWAVLERVRQTGAGKDYLLSTACLCHGVLDAFRLTN